MTVSNMPREMVVEVLSRLPPRSLMRFKCIHRSWNSLINSDNFVAKHLRFQNHMSSSTCILLKRCVMQKTETSVEEIVCTLLTLRSKDNWHEDNVEYDIEDIHFPPSIGPRSRGQFVEIPGHSYECVHIVGHCDGIFCLNLHTTSDLVLYNPAIKQVKPLPETCLRHECIGALGFGYDPKCEDYILVSVARFGEEDYDPRVVMDPLREELYTLGTGSWREIKIDNLETETSFFWPSNFQFYLKGKCYWIAREELKPSPA